MIWDIALWTAAAVLVIVVAARIVGARSTKASKGRAKSKQPQSNGNILTQGKGLPTAAVVILVLALIMKFGPALVNSRPYWSGDERAEVEIFRGAIFQYDQATLNKDQGDLRIEDWETIKALLEASGSEMSMVSDDVLREIHEELPTHVKEEFLPGIRMGSFGLLGYISQPAKGIPPEDDPVKKAAYDSLDQARELLGLWNAWFQTNREEILRRTE